jgi:hypothetical protein
MSDKRIYVERRPEGDYDVRRPGSERASDVTPTQAGRRAGAGNQSGRRGARGARALHDRREAG